MRTEVPVCRKCCFCLPLRYGLLAWAYFKLIIDVVLVLFLLFLLYLCLFVFHERYPPEVTMQIVLLTILIIDMALNTMFIVGAHKKEVKLLRVYFAYSVVLWLMAALLEIICFVTIMYALTSLLYDSFMMTLLGSETTSGFVNLVIQTYFILLIRSEIIKLNNIGNCRFVNNAAEAECSLKMEYEYTKYDIYNDYIENDTVVEEDDMENGYDVRQCGKYNDTCGSRTCCKGVWNSEHNI